MKKRIQRRQKLRAKLNLPIEVWPLETDLYCMKCKTYIAIDQIKATNGEKTPKYCLCGVTK